MRFNDVFYLNAAKEHTALLRDLHDDGYYVLSHYVSGLAVECLFRAYYYKIERQFVERHDLYEWARRSRFLDTVSERNTEVVGAALFEVATRWNNNLRYCSEASLRVFLKKAGKDRGIRGDFIKESSRRIVNASIVLVTHGVLKWKS